MKHIGYFSDFTDADEACDAALDAFERLLTYGRRPEGAGVTFTFRDGGAFFLSDKDATAIRAALVAKDGGRWTARRKTKRF